MLTAETVAAGQLNRYRGAFRSDGALGRWIGCCRSCGAGMRVDGEPLYDSKGDAAVIGADGLLYTTRVLNTHEIVLIRHDCPGGRWVFARRVFDGGRPDSKRHTCGARCTNATGPSCDCRCRGANHGSGHAAA